MAIRIMTSLPAEDATLMVRRSALSFSGAPLIVLASCAAAAAAASATASSSFLVAGWSSSFKLACIGRRDQHGAVLRVPNKGTRRRGKCAARRLRSAIALTVALLELVDLARRPRVRQERA